MKRKLLILLLLAIACLCVACGDKKVDVPKSTKPVTNAAVTSKPDSKAQTSTPKNILSASKDGITFTIINSKVKSYSDENSEYTKQLIVKFKIKNETKKAFGYTTIDWDAVTPDGYKLEGLNNLMDADLKQVHANSETTDKTIFLLKEDSIDKVNLTYSFMDYNAEYWKDFGKIVSGEMSEKQYKDKYESKQSNMNFAIDVKNK